ncbi:MAG: phage portal protein [Legionellaceae bacterium]|nr:phage portal protein [Legionellaceae bacterium]
MAKKLKSETQDPTPEFIKSAARVPEGIEDAIKQYDVLQHDIFDKTKRKDKDVAKPGVDDNGNETVVNSTEPVNRIGLAFQQLIVKRRAAFMNLGALTLVAKPNGTAEESLVAATKAVLDDNKMKFKLKKIARGVMSEKQAAVLFYSDIETGPEGKDTPHLKARLLSPKMGDELLPVFDSFGKLQYFGRGYKTRAGDKEFEHMDIYSSEKIFQWSNESGEVTLNGTVTHKYGKIPIAYFSQEETEWAIVQAIIERLEELLSNFGDTNDYNGSPILVARGVIKGFSSKGERGKVLEIEGEQADVKYVSWEQAPESIKLEIETLTNLLMSLSQTPDISSKGMADLGLDSGVAFDRVFLDAQLAAQDKLDEDFGEVLQRMVNFIKTAICNVFDTSLKSAIGMKIEVEVPTFRINEVSETIDNMMAANGGKPIISHKTSVAMSGLVEDAEAEFELIEAQEDSLGREIETEI